MTYALGGLLAYLVLGFALTRSILPSTHRMRFRDAVMGAAFMPILFIVYLLCILADELWKRLLIALDYDPPEEMRAGPAAPATSDDRPPQNVP